MSIKDLNESELLEVISNGSSPKKRRNKNKSIDSFVRKYEIARGETKVPNYLIYYIYVTNPSMNSAFKVSKPAFFRHMSTEFATYRHGAQRFYLINWNVEVTPELKQRAKAYDRKYQSANVRRRDEKED